MRVDALVVSGFLGSGKTTLVRHLLAEAQRTGHRVAVITNEFGELGIDRALLSEGVGDRIELEGGCVCCQLSDELVETLVRLRDEVDPERVIVETSGVALPWDTQLHFFREPIAGWVRECVSCVVVNAEQLHTRRDLEGTFEDQVTSSDLLVLNQIDRVPGDALTPLEERLRELEPDAPIVRTEQARVDPALLFPEPATSRARSLQPRSHVHEPFQTEIVDVAHGIAREALRAEVESLQALRVKGFAACAEGLHLVQGVGPRIEVEPIASVPDESVVGRLVVIRRGIL